MASPISLTLNVRCFIWKHVHEVCAHTSFPGLRMFNQQELRQLIGGEETIIDLDDLRAHSVVSGFANDDTVKLFWKVSRGLLEWSCRLKPDQVVKSFDHEQRRALLRFVTSCSRPPLLGFQNLNPNFGIRCAGSDTSRLPSACKCPHWLCAGCLTHNQHHVSICSSCKA